MTSRQLPKKSLKIILTRWFLAFSVVPVTFVAGYSLIKFEEAINYEVSRRLKDQTREINVLFNDIKRNFDFKIDKYKSNQVLVQNLLYTNTPALSRLAEDLLNKEKLQSLSFFSKEGRLLVSVNVNGRSLQKYIGHIQQPIFLSDESLKILKKNQDFYVHEYRNKNLSLIHTFPLMNAQGIVGFGEQIINFDERYISNISKKMDAEIALIDSQGKPQISSHADFYLYEPGFYKNFFSKKDHSADLSMRGEPYRLTTALIPWGNQSIDFVIASSKKESQSVLKKLNIAYLGIIGIVLALTIIFVVIASFYLLKPLYELLKSIQSFEFSQMSVPIPIKSETELGLLTEEFNSLTKKIHHAQLELSNKIKELEVINDELKRTQAQLVQSAKMTSLGQLVAGVAHELNNPISFIYSNMGQMKDYGEKLIQFSKQLQAQPLQAEDLKKKYDIEYITTDLPKLIKSCEEGARRTKDIVSGLKTFSRLDESDVQEVNINDCIDNTLSLLTGEYKTRIEVEKDYQKLPLVQCHAGQINQVIMNLLTNASQAIASKGKIFIKTEKLEDKVSIKIRDNGQGIDKKDLNKIFDPFFTTKKIGEGTGLGLSISYGIIQSHKGDIKVHSEPGLGSEFQIILPIQYQG